MTDTTPACPKCDDTGDVKCPDCDGLGYIRCACWPGDCICGLDDQDCENCNGGGVVWCDCQSEDRDDDYEYESRRDERGKA